MSRYGWKDDSGKIKSWFDQPKKNQTKRSLGKIAASIASLHRQNQKEFSVSRLLSSVVRNIASYDNIVIWIGLVDRWHLDYRHHYDENGNRWGVILHKQQKINYGNFSSRRKFTHLSARRRYLSNQFQWACSTCARRREDLYSEFYQSFHIWMNQ